MERRRRASASAVRDRIIAAWDRLLREEKTAGVRAALRAVDARPVPGRRPGRGAGRRRGEDGGAGGAAGGPGAAAGVRGLPGRERGDRCGVGGGSCWEAAVGRRPAGPGAADDPGRHLPDQPGRGGGGAAAVVPGGGGGRPDQPDRAQQPGGSCCRTRRTWPARRRPTARPSDSTPQTPSAHDNLGRAAVQRKEDLEGAVGRVHSEAIRLDPKCAMAHNNLGLALKLKGDLEGAVAEYQEALRIDPKQEYSDLSNLPIAERMRQLLPRAARRSRRQGQAGGPRPRHAASPGFAASGSRSTTRPPPACMKGLSRPTRSWPPTSRRVTATTPPATPSGPPAARGSTPRPTPRPGRPCGGRPSAGSAPTWTFAGSRPSHDGRHGRR